MKEQEIKSGQVWKHNSNDSLLTIKCVGERLCIYSYGTCGEGTTEAAQIRKQFTLQEPKPERKRMWRWARVNVHNNCCSVARSYYENYAAGYIKIEHDYLDFDLINGKWELVQRGEE